MGKKEKVVIGTINQDKCYIISISSQFLLLVNAVNFKLTQGTEHKVLLLLPLFLLGALYFSFKFVPLAYLSLQF
jgi:hypothetical protein